MISNTDITIGNSCSLLEVSRSSYYSWQQRSCLPEIKDETRDRIKEICTDFSKYGYRRVTKQLHRDGKIINTKKVRRIMKEEKLVVRKKKYKPITTQSNHNLQTYPNLAKNFTPVGVNQLWVADITYIRLLYEFVYLAAITDVFSRRCVGWVLSRNIDAQLALSALNKAIELRGKENVVACIHHSDQGVQYAATAYVQKLKEHGMLASMSRKGNCYDNAFAETFFKTLKYEEVLMNEYQTFDDAYQNIKRFIEEVYNKKRLHSSIGYVPPEEFENKMLNMSLT
jgi:transposase InsO family protein